MSEKNRCLPTCIIRTGGKMNIVSYTKKFHSKTVDDVGMYNICIEVDRAQYNHARLGQILLGGIKQLTKYGVVYNRWDTSVFQELYVTTLPWTISQYHQNINLHYFGYFLSHFQSPLLYII